MAKCRACDTLQSMMSASEQCPPDSRLLGRHSWTLLHSFAAYYPKQPSDAEKRVAIEFLRSFSQIYPCSHCADDLRDYMAKSPPNVEDRFKLSEWLCVMHNDVNLKLGKPQFDCSKVLERWLHGGPHCGPN